jgi:tetratricopeptide (TPR) repeat protein
MSMEIEEPAPSFNFEEPSPSFDLDLDSSPALELDFSSIPEPAPAPAPAPPPPPPAAPSRLAPAVEIAAADLSGNESDDLDFITEHLTEAEVFAKYGLAEKAAEHLRSVLERSPTNLTAHERLYKILLDEGDVDAARDAALAFVDLLMENGNDDAIAAVNNEFLARGHALAPEAKAAPVSVPAFEPEPEPEIDTAEEELSFDLDSTPSAFEIDSVSTSSVADFAPPQEETIEFADLSAELEEEPEPETAIEEPFFGVEASTSFGPTAEEIGEVDFYIGQELYDDARERVEALAARFPDDPDVEARRAKIDAAATTAAPPPPPATKTAPGTLSRDEIESELLSAIPDDDEDRASGASSPAARCAAGGAGGSTRDRRGESVRG